MRNVVIAGLFFTAIFGFLGWLSGKDLVSDLTANKDVLERSVNHRVTEARCRTRYAIFGHCTIKIRANDNGKSHEFTYLMFGEPKQTRVVVMTDPQNTLVTTNIGIENRANRGLMFAGFLVVFGSVLFKLFRQARG